MSESAPAPLHRRLLERIARHGPLPFSTVMEAALYDEHHGFYAAAGGAAGRRGDFITSPEVGPLFGAVLARALDAWWEELGQPDPYLVVEAGAGVGTLAVSVLAAQPRCAPALRYLLVERSTALRAQQAAYLALAEPVTALGVPGGHDGPVVASLSTLPAAPFTGVILANELLDNLPFDLLTLTDDGWGEIRVGADDPLAASPRLTRHVVPAGGAAAAAGARFAPDARVGSVIPWQHDASNWVTSAHELIERGRLVAIDYAVRSTASLANRPVEEWLRVYRAHEREIDPLEAVGSADITADVAVDQLEAAIGPAEVRTQAELLDAFGVGDLVDEGRRVWEERAGVGDLSAVKARSRVREAEALTAPDGLGAFLAMEWPRS